MSWFVVLVAVVLGACSTDGGPRGLGDRCSTAADCPAALDCAGGTCLGEHLVRGRVFAPSSGATDQDGLGVLLFAAGDPGGDDPLVPALAALSRSYPAPAQYPSSVQLSGVPAGDYEVVAYVALPDQRTVRGQAAVTIDATGAPEVNGVPAAEVTPRLPGESAPDP